jgi:hypothetical protein
MQFTYLQPEITKSRIGHGAKNAAVFLERSLFAPRCPDSPHGRACG